MSFTKFEFKPPIIAHRGASAQAPENTITAFLKAKELGINWVEFDCMLSKDHELVIIHDETLDRTSTAKGNVSDYPFSFLKTLDIGSWFDKKFSADKIINLEQLIKIVNQEKIFTNIEVKSHVGTESLTIKRLLEVLNEFWNPSNPPPLVSSFSIEILKGLRKSSKNLQLGLLMDEWIDDWQSLANELICSSINVNHDLLTRDRVKQIKNAGFILLAYTVNDPARAAQLFEFGVDAVFSDCSNEMIAYAKTIL